jgi:uncharacterized protein
MMTTGTGRFVWYELMTTDLAAAQAFYTEIIGWTTKRWEENNYTMWAAGEQSVGGVMLLPEAAQKMGAPPHWVGYVATDDVDATVKKAQELGGRVYVPGTDIPTVGRFAVLADPQGATFAVYKSLTATSGEPVEKPGHFTWAELNSTDYESAWKFYSELFGWKPTSAMDMGPEFGKYFMFGVTAEKSMGGMSNAANMMKAPAHWLHYIVVPDIDATVALIKEKGGRVLNGPMDIPGGDRIAQCMDPQGAAFAIYGSGRK